ncbi:MAG: MerR family transcriptional regulator [Gemmatimonadales bacterium]|nr:MerR family transcriptional regulator [Gemmatimonadales bacterium]
MNSAYRTYEIHEVANLTGLTPDRLRVWERRYEVVRPGRQPNGYRAYTADQVALLRAFARLVGRGARIGELVGRPAAEVVEKAWEETEDGTPLGAMLAAIRRLDRGPLEVLVADELATRGLSRFADEIVLPLAELIGDLWAVGDLPIAGEHLASEVVLHALKGGLNSQRNNGPLLLCAALPGERHEWGFLVTLARLHGLGWQPDYLGTDLPLEEIIQAAWRLAPAGVALSVSDPESCAFALDVLLTLPSRLPTGCFAAIGGAGIEGRQRVLADAGFRLGLEHFALLPSAIAR